MGAVLNVPELSDLDVAFAANALQWMPKWDDIPAEFKQWDGTEWNRIVSSWFSVGLPPDVEFYPHDGVDAEAAFRAISATLRSFRPKHEHKEAAAAYMLSCWFREVKGWEK